MITQKLPQRTNDINQRLKLENCNYRTKKLLQKIPNFY